MNRLIFNSLLILSISLGVLIAGTDGTIRGKITDTDGAPLAGANIYVPSLGVGAAADMEGNYIILNIREYFLPLAKSAPSMIYKI